MGSDMGHSAVLGVAIFVAILGAAGMLGVVVVEVHGLFRRWFRRRDR